MPLHFELTEMSERRSRAAAAVRAAGLDALLMFKQESIPLVWAEVAELYCYRCETPARQPLWRDAP